MSYFFKFFLLFSLIFNYVYANDYRDIVTVKLKKDEHKKILVKYDNRQKIFTFRWTLFVNERLVVLHSYDKIVGQNVLSLNYKNQSFKVELKTRGADFYNVPYLLVKFKEFDKKTHKAVFELFLSDSKMQVNLKYLKRDDAKSRE